MSYPEYLAELTDGTLLKCQIQPTAMYNNKSFQLHTNKGATIGPLHATKPKMLLNLLDKHFKEHGGVRTLVDA